MNPPPPRVFPRGASRSTGRAFIPSAGAWQTLVYQGGVCKSPWKGGHPEAAAGLIFFALLTTVFACQWGN